MQEIIGAKITAARVMTKEEQEAEGWERPGGTILLELDNGMKIYPSQDEEGNGPGALFGLARDGMQVRISVQ